MLPPVVMTAAPRLQVPLAVEGGGAQVHPRRRTTRLSLTAFAHAVKGLVRLLRCQSASHPRVINRQDTFVLAFPDQLVTGLEEDVVATGRHPEELARLDRMAGRDQAERPVTPLVDVFGAVDVMGKKRCPGLEDDLPSVFAQVREVEVQVRRYSAGFRRGGDEFAISRCDLGGAAGDTDDASVRVVVAVDLATFFVWIIR